MFDYEEIIEFINRLINAPKLTKEEIIEKVSNFVEYLEIADMTDEITLGKLIKIVKCLDSILTIKSVVGGSIDIRSLLSEQPDTPMKLTKKPKQPRKHYNHTRRDSSSSDSYSYSCGSSSVSSSHC